MVMAPCVLGDGDTVYQCQIAIFSQASGRLSCDAPPHLSGLNAGSPELRALYLLYDYVLDPSIHPPWLYSSIPSYWFIQAFSI